MAGTLSVQQIQGLASAADPTTVTIPSGHKLVGEDAASISAPGTPIQMFQHSTNATLSGTLGFANSPTSTSGTSFTTFNFTPKKSDSDLYIWSSGIAIYETSNVADQSFVSAWYDTTKVALNYVPLRYSSFNGALNATIICLFGKISSWGTSQKTITVRVGMNGGSAVVNYDSSYYAQHGGQNGNNYVYFNVMEVAT
jgi:hypothetical protein